MMNKKFFIIIGIILLVIILVWLSDDETVENIGDDTYTLMIYMCASDLESDGGFATADLSEMINTNIDEKINVIVETGGTTQWQDYGIANDRNQIYKIEDNELKLIKDDLGIKSMIEPSSLSEFIDYCKNDYPASKYGLILWDHGGGAISGYGYDENNSNTDDTLTIDELKTALDNSNVKFEFVGFDACLMANVETAYAIKDNANYLIASEETEPGTGWDYESILNKLSSNTSEKTEEIGKTVVDSFIESNNSLLDFSDATLSIVDLTKIENVFSKLNEFVASIKKESLDTNNFAYISKAVNNSKSYGDGCFDTIDLVDFAKQVNNSASNDLIQSLEEAIVYNKTTDLVENSSGLSIYFPYQDLEYFDKMLEIYPKIGIDTNYINILTDFTNILAGGKNDSYEINNHNYSVEEDFSEYDWYDENYIDDNSYYYEDNDYNELEIVESDGGYCLELSDEDWENIASITCEVLYDDEEGYLDLGSDDFYELDDNGNLKIEYDGTWISINGQVVSYYTLESTDKYIKGQVAAYLNDELVNIVLCWNDEYPDGIVLGYNYVDEYGDTTISSKGLKKIEDGDKIEFLFDYYTYDGDYDDSYIVGDELIVNGDLKVSYEDVGDNEFYVYYKIIDIYGNEYYTEPIIIE